jgi:hypothetical protein
MVGLINVEKGGQKENKLVKRQSSVRNQSQQHQHDSLGKDYQIELVLHGE